MKTFNFENFTCKLGENAADNWSLLDTSKKEYKFFHLSSFPSGYVILEYEEEPTDIMIYTSAKLCKEYSKYKNLKNIKVDWCQCDNLQKGEKVGEVYFKSNRKVRQIKV